MADGFYSARRDKLERSVEKTGMSENAKQAVLDADSLVKKPFVFEYTDGYQRFFSIMYTTGFLTAAAISIIFAPIFSGEYISGADSLILSSKHGRNLLIPAKLFVVAVSSVCFSVSLTAITYGICMLVWGADGAGAAIQLLHPLAPYPLRVGQCALLYSLCVTAACLMVGMMTSVLSAKLRTPFASVIIMMIILTESSLLIMTFHRDKHP